MLITEIEKIYNTYDSLERIIHDKIAANKQERAFYVADISDIYKKHLKWLNLLPRVKPFFAVKCNNLPQVLSFLASLGTSFDCASKQEIEQILSLGVDPDKIIYANPCKTNAFIRHAKNVNVNLMTFDNELELHKVAQLHPNAQLVLRIKGDEASSRCKFNMKFGADLAKCNHLLKKAKQLNLNVMGVSFHNGSDCKDPESYRKSIAACRLVFDMGNELGHQMRMLDIGGGFPGDSTAKIPFETLAESVNYALEEYFPASSCEDIEIIAEPGRYYVSSAMTLCSMVIAKRQEFDDKTGKDGFMYYLNEGVYGAFNNVLFEHYKPEPQLIKPLGGHQQINNRFDNNDVEHNNNLGDSDIQKEYVSVMWGPTCDSIDCIKRDFLFPELQIGQWVMFKNMGAYTCCAASNFNGFEMATVIIANDIEQTNKNEINNININGNKLTNGHGIFNGNRNENESRNKIEINDVAAKTNGKHFEHRANNPKD